MSKFRVVWEQHRLDGVWETEVEADDAEAARNIIERRSPGVAKRIETTRVCTQIVRKVERVA